MGENLEYLGERLVHMSRGTYMWCNIKTFAYGEGQQADHGPLP
ncbi:hypothetical protein [Mycobacteroides sp. CBMA 271]|nr:hypothetical protein [Mycobacteroides sp. CBMA 271]